MEERGIKKRLVGEVTSNKMDKTVVVSIERIFKHPQYKKYLKKIKKIKAHDEKNKCNIGDRVEIIESKPISKEKKWRVSKILVVSSKLAS